MTADRAEQIELMEKEYRRAQSMIEQSVAEIDTDGGVGSDEVTIFVGNFAHLMIGIRSEIRVEVLKERLADNLQYGLLAHMRADIAAQHEAAFHTITGVQG